ncbi:MAG TPA: alcohol dehydrogenase catalytic domain-containing protein [Solirubrobacterales bacterium]|nr:alcohol dehydrogenase catalytic domain-containing protein [Solirubrobacterales bacterium]
MPTETMQAAVLTSPGRIESQSLLVPEPGPGELLVKVFATGICGSDLAVYRGTHPYKTAPIVLGHELAGRVVRTGAGVAGFAPGDRVCAASFSHCERCGPCRSGQMHLCERKATLCHRGWNGSFAEYVLLKQNMTFRLPDRVDWQLGALVEPLSIGLHAIRIPERQLEGGRSLAILGSGNIGLCCLIAANRLGFQVACVDIRPEAGPTALALGAAAFVDARVEPPADGVAAGLACPADAVVVAADYDQVFADALAMTTPGGVVVVVSYFERSRQLPLNCLVGDEQTVVGSALSTPADIKDVLAWLADGTIDPRPLIAHAPSLSRVAEAMKSMDSGVGRAGKIVLGVAEEGEARND